eukprot:jgi/Chrzof1/3206/Cz12g15240.t1
MATPAAGILPFGSPLFTQCTVVDKRPPDSTARTPFISPPDAQLLHLSDSPSQTPLPSSDSLMGDQAGKVHTTTEFAAGPTPVAIRTQEQTANVGPMIGIQALANDEHSDAVCSGSSTLTTPQPADTHSSRQGAKGGVQTPCSQQPRFKLSKPERVPTGNKPAASSELKQLLRNGGDALAKDLGAMSILTPVRAKKKVQETLGGKDQVLTPVRRSARKAQLPTHSEVAPMLEATNFCYAPNACLQEHPGYETQGTGSER